MKSKDKDIIESAAAKAKKDDKYAFIELIGIFTPYISSLAKSFGLPESEYDDLCQTGRIALFRAVLSYEPKRCSFTTFARVCIKNAMISFVRDFSSKSKGRTLIIPFDDAENENVCVSEDTPENLYIASEFARQIEKALSTCLSEKEYKVMNYRLSGIGIPEISIIMDSDVKSVQNTLFRARRKLKTFLKNN
ncbi:MAG: sigma-70 family RNA polymerase sigma factor [Clostridia bacterium]|nr:sigma-70 family RNA polymerase sigma factor [Clostridia bacterium]